MEYYKILDVKENATAQEIKSAYKKKAKQSHPDQGGNAEEFRKINEAYQILSNPQKRQTYDQYGTAEAPQPNFRSSHFTDDNFDDVLRNFGFNVNFGNGFQQRAVQKNKDIKLAYIIDMIHIYEGKTDTIVYSLPSGKEEMIVVKVPPGVRQGNMIKFQDQGDDSYSHLPRGDLIVEISVRPHKEFFIKGNDVYGKISVKMIDLLCGSVQDINSPNGSIISLTIPKGTAPNTKFNITNHGLPLLNTYASGNFLIELTCEMPNLSHTQVAELKDFATKSKIFD